MKTKTLLMACLLLSIGLTQLSAQTVQLEMRMPFTHMNMYCLGPDIFVSGEWTYHLTYHLNRKTGTVDHLHWNILKSNITNDATGEKYILMDTGNDNWGSVVIGAWDMWNNIQALNAGYGVYDNFVDGQIPLPDNADRPVEGSAVFPNFKIISKGGIVVSTTFIVQFHINAQGEITVDKTKSTWNCN